MHDMKRTRVLVLMHRDLVPPENVDGMSIDDIAPFKTELDVVSALRKCGYPVRALGVGGELGVIRETIEQWRPRIVFNLLEEFAGEATLDQNVVSYLELVRMPYTGNGPRALMLARDKALAKNILAAHRIPVPAHEVFPVGRAINRPKKLEFPLFVKSLNEEASLGIAQASIVRDDDQLAERVAFIHEKIGTDAIAETYIEGREFYVAVMGNRRLQVFPIWELLFTKAPDEVPRIATAKVKWDRRYQEKVGIVTRQAEDLPPGVAEKIVRMCKRIYRLLGMSGYARIDLRMTPEGKVYVLEANPNPQIALGEDFADSARAGGVSYLQLIQCIVSLGLRRHRQRVNV